MEYNEYSEEQEYSIVIHRGAHVKLSQVSYQFYESSILAVKSKCNGTPKCAITRHCGKTSRLRFARRANII